MVAEMLQKSKKNILFYMHVIWSFIFIVYFIFMLYVFSCIYHIFIFISCFLFLLHILIFILFYFNVFIFIIRTKLFQCSILITTKYILMIWFFMLYENFYMIFTGHSAVEMWSSIFINLTRVLYQICLADCSRLHYQIYLLKMII